MKETYKSFSIAKTLGSVLLLSFLISACTTVGPNYSPPGMKTPGAWQKQQAGVNAVQTSQESLSKWWTTFNDPVLSGLMEKAVAENLDIKQAFSHVKQARIQRGITGAAQYPSVNAKGSAGRSYRKDIKGDFSGTNNLSLGLDASWEPDLFGGLKRTLEAADAELQATEESYRATLVSLLAEVAINYVQMRSFQSQLAVVEANLKSQEETYNITQWRYQAGLTTVLDVERASSNLEGTRSQMPSLKSSIEQTKNTIAVLLGSQPGALDADLDAYKPVPVAPEDVTIGIPAGLLRRRPDLRKAERDLAAQTARIGVSEARLYPSISLSGSIGLDALSFGKLFSTDSLSTGVSSIINWPVYKAGAIMKDIEVQKELQGQTLIAYEATLLTALKDVENALIAYSYDQTRRESLIKQSKFAEQAAETSRAQYTSGLIDFQSVLDAERTVLSAQDQVARNDAQVITDLIGLYKALGGGWSMVEEAQQN
jgi:NodT family efflux transporter outer membrane factor (OMF) lipoprotein